MIDLIKNYKYGSTCIAWPGIHVYIYIFLLKKVESFYKK